jgi:hypothetical protein
MEEYEVVEDMQMQQPSTPQNAYYQPVIQASEKADLFDKINPQDIIETLKYLLMGYSFDRNKQEWYKNKWANGLSERGATEITTLMLSVSNKNVAISKLNDSEVRMRTKEIHKEAIRMALRNWKPYGINGPDQIGLISQIVVSNTFITLKQPENAGIRELIKGTTQESRMITESPERKGVLGSLFRR